MTPALGERGEVAVLRLVERRVNFEVADEIGVVAHAGRECLRLWDSGGASTDAAKHLHRCGQWRHSHRVRRRHLDDPWELPDVAAFLTDLSRRIDLRPGLDLLVVVDDSDVRRVLGLEELAQPAHPETDPGELAYAIFEQPMQRLCPSWEEDPGPPHCTVHLLRCRDGRVVPAPDDIRLGYAMLYAKNFLTVYSGDIIVLTPYGWRVGRRAGAAPTLTSLGGRGLRAVDLPQGA